MLVFLTKLGIMRFPVSFSVLLFHFSVLDGFGRGLQVKFSQKCPINAGVPQVPFFSPTLSTIYNFHSLPDVTCNMAIYADDTALCCKCDQASHLWQ